MNIHVLMPLNAKNSPHLLPAGPEKYNVYYLLNLFILQTLSKMIYCTIQDKVGQEVFKTFDIFGIKLYSSHCLICKESYYQIRLRGGLEETQLLTVRKYVPENERMDKFDFVIIK